MSGFSVGARPDPEVAAGAARYQRGNGMRIERPRYGNIVMPSSATSQISAAYGRMPSFHEGALPAYRAMREETGRQFDFMTKSARQGGLGIDTEVTKHDPYGLGGSYHSVVNDLRNDVQNNHRIKVMSTETTGAHPFFSNDQNDMFRAVHDVFGHLGSGRGVDRHGEEAAFQKHASMFTPLARAAMATETRGQNAWVHSGGNGEFGEQKVGLLPAAMRRLNFTSGAASVSDRQQALRQNQGQGLN